MQSDSIPLGHPESAQRLFAALIQRIPSLTESPESNYGIQKGWGRVFLFGHTRGTVLNVTYRASPLPTIKLTSPARMVPPGEEPSRLPPWLVWGAPPQKLTDNGTLDMIFDTLGTAKYFKAPPQREPFPSLDHPIMAQSSYPELTALVRGPRWLQLYRCLDSLRPLVANSLGLQHPYLCAGHGPVLHFVVPLDPTRTVGDAAKVVEMFQSMCGEVEAASGAIPSAQSPLPIVRMNMGFGMSEYVLYRCPRCGQMEPTVSKLARTGLLTKDWVNSMTVKCRVPLFREA